MVLENGVLLLESRRVAVQHVGPVEHPRIQIAGRAVVVISLTDQVVAVWLDCEFRIVVLNSELELWNV
jgi:hypothetical protein